MAKQQRRYPTGMFEYYDNRYMYQKNNSPVFGNSDRTGLHQIMFDKKGCEGYKNELIGDKKGEYIRNGSRTIAHIPSLKNAYDKVLEQFNSYCDNQENLGFERPEIWPDDLLQQKLSLEAQIDIANEELNKIDERLKTFKEPEIQRNDSEVLKYGLLGSCQLQDNYPVEIDGQTVVRLNGIFIIKDDRSPYYGMSLKNYRVLSAQWKEDRKKLDSEEYIRIQKEAQKRGLPVPGGYSSYGNSIPREELPKWPEGVINHLQKKETE